MTERNLAAAMARVGVATADLFPRITLFGSVALQATSLTGLFKGGSDTFAIGPNIFWAAFDLGRVRARIRAADARTEAALAQYEQRGGFPDLLCHAASTLPRQKRVVRDRG